MRKERPLPFPLGRLPGARSPAWVLAETVTAAAFAFLSLLLIARAIGPEEAGTGALAIAAFLLLDLAGAALFTDALVQRPRLTRREAASALTAQVLAGLGAAVLLALAAPAVARWLDAPASLPLMWALAPLLPLSAFSGAAAGLALRDQRYRLLALRALVGLPLGLAAGLVAARAGLGAWAMVALQATATVIVFLLMLAALAGRRLRPRLSLRALGALWPVAGPQVLSVVVQAGRYRMFVLALGMVVAEAVVAVCNIAFRLLDSVLVVVWSSIGRLALPRFARLQDDRRGALAEAYGEIAELQALIGMPIAAGVALTAPELVRGLMGPAWASAAEAAQVVGWVAVATFTWGDTASLFVALGRTRRNLATALVALAVPLAALLLLRPTGAVGAAWCWAAGAVAVGPLVATMALREIGRSPLWLMRQVAPALGATAVMAAAVMLVRAELPPLAPLAGLAMAAGVGAAVYLAVAWLGIGRRLPRALTEAAAVRPATLPMRPGKEAAALGPVG